MGFTRPPPCAATRPTVLRRGDRDAVEAQLGAWAEGLLAGPPVPQDTPEGLAIDGTTRRGSRQQGAPGVPLLSALAHRVGLTVAQHAVADTTNEIPVALELLRPVVLEGRGVTMDALLTQRALAPQVIEAGGDYVMSVKENQPRLREEIATVLAHAPIAGETRTVTETVDVGHGRIEQRRLQTRDVLVGSSDWPGRAPVLQVERQTIMKKTGAVREEVVMGVTSLAPERADATRLLALGRGHWQIEHTSHWVRDVTFDEDRSQGRCGHIPQVMAGLRNTVIGLMRWAGYTNMAAACRRFAAPPALALELIGIALEN